MSNNRWVLVDDLQEEAPPRQRGNSTGSPSLAYSLSKPLLGTPATHNHYIKPVPPMYVTEYESAYQPPPVSYYRQNSLQVLPPAGTRRDPNLPGFKLSGPPIPSHHGASGKKKQKQIQPVKQAKPEHVKLFRNEATSTDGNNDRVKSPPIYRPSHIPSPIPSSISRTGGGGGA